MDQMKENVAQAVQKAVLDRMYNQKGVVANPVDDLTTQIRVSTPNGPRYFHVKVTEKL